MQIIEGLEAAQRIGILHRDIKPSNCYVGEDGAVKIGDFGLSISTAVRTEPALTATGAFLGTPAFCSPEQLRGEELNARSDMYSVGATLFYLLTGRTPFEAKNMVQLLATVLEQRAPSPRQVPPRDSARAGQSGAALPRKAAGRTVQELRRPGPGAGALQLDRADAGDPGPALPGRSGGYDDPGRAGDSLINLSAFGSPMEFMDQAMQLSPKTLACVLGWVCVATLYYALFEGLWGAAVGKALCRLRVVGPDRNPPGFARAWLRALVYAVPPACPTGWPLARIQRPT